MVTLLTIIHIFVCVFLILVVLLQPGRSGGMGAAFGGASQAVFGARGATSFLGKVTAICAMVFMLTSIGLSYLATSKEKSLRAAAERQEERAKARDVRPTKAAKTKAGAMSTPDEEGEDAQKAPAPSKAAPPDADADEGAPERPTPAPAEGRTAPAPPPAPAEEPAPAPTPSKATKAPATP